MDKEWYLWAYQTKTYLHNKKLSYQTDFPHPHDHRHCEVCWDRFSSHDSDLHSGYFEKESDSWICNKCYDELKSVFGWYI